MPIFTIYNKTDGVILTSGSCSDDKVPSLPDDDHDYLYGVDGMPHSEMVDLATMTIVPAVRHMEDEELMAVIERTRNEFLASGFDYDFGDERGVHRIGTTAKDMEGWDEVSQLTTLLVRRGTPNEKILISTDTGPVLIEAHEWDDVLYHGAVNLRQPVWQRSFELAAMSPIPQDVGDPARWIINQ